MLMSCAMPPPSPTNFSQRTAIAVVIASMVGTGIFTSLGFQLLDIQSGFVLMMLWTVGGVTALCGALTYAELGSALPRSGGEYNFLTEIYHPGAGFVSGWVSATIGFAAPSALAAITFGTYLASVFPRLSPTWLAVGLVVLLALAHANTRRSSGGIQRIFTSMKIVLIVSFCVVAWRPTSSVFALLVTSFVDCCWIQRFGDHRTTAWLTLRPFSPGPAR